LRGSVKLEDEMVYLEAAIEIAFTRGNYSARCALHRLSKSEGLRPLVSDA